MANVKGRVRIATLNPAPYNPRTITGEALDGLAASIRNGTQHAADWDPSRGYRLDTTITVNRQGRRIIGGHQRVKALAEKLGQPWIHKDDITWIDLEPDSPAEKARVLSLNNQTIAGDWTPATLALLEEIKVPEVDFSAMNLDALQEELQASFKAIDDPGDIGNDHNSAPERDETVLYAIVITCQDEHDQIRLLERFQLEGITCKAIVS